ncbi:PREDICTED: RNA/RNP complex-1-interacting phosphatase [Rhagoletis zephyria]|uniref:RNA/RNP complex-1-interacting phosphatase n=1 Tax=Rhagoletis zephyria TaxID=28612 RepID=UPI0008117F1A|nr:PREDICTED: RNA/RNP complex-1-interacting phosphatase [Rhagoletis zephyria]
MVSSIPDRWLSYKPVGKQIEGTRFIAFKVPLRERVNENVDEEHRLDANILLKTVPNLGMIIDLTNTTRYYNPHNFKDKGLEYIKLMIPGHDTPSPRMINQFKTLAMTFLNNNSDNDKLIGVHCTHGVNRTGFLICNYMISELDMKPEEAIDKFAAARGHKIERRNYLVSLNHLKNAIKSDNSGSPKNDFKDDLIDNNKRAIRSNQTHSKEISSLHSPAPESALPPSTEEFDRRDRYERFRQESNMQRQRHTSAAVTAAAQSEQQYMDNNFNSAQGNSSNYNRRYVNTSRNCSQGGANYPYHNNHNSYAMHSNNSHSRAPDSRRYDEEPSRRRNEHVPSSSDRYSGERRHDRHRSHPYRRV